MYSSLYVPLAYLPILSNSNQVHQQHEYNLPLAGVTHATAHRIPDTWITGSHPTTHTTSKYIHTTHTTSTRHTLHLHNTHYIYTTHTTSARHTLHLHDTHYIYTTHTTSTRHTLQQTDRSKVAMSTYLALISMTR